MKYSQYKRGDAIVIVPVGVNAMVEDRFRTVKLTSFRSQGGSQFEFRGRLVDGGKARGPVHHFSSRNWRITGPGYCEG